MPGRNDKKVAVLIPCYNEAGTIEKVIRDYRGVLPDADIYVYDNNSTDGTDEIAARAGAIVRHEYKQGKGNVIRTMFREIPVEYRDRPEGSVSKLNTYADGMKVLGTIFKLYKDYKPMAFFGIFALVFLLASVGFFIPVLVDYIRTGLVPRYPTMIVSVTLALFALLSFLIGVVLDVIVKKHRQLYELFLNLLQEGEHDKDA